MGTEAIPKTEEAVPAESPSYVETQIIRQIEYYFGNYNLCRDKFLKEQVKLDDGWVALETLVKFNRLKKLSQDYTVIIEALKKSSKQLMEINEDCTKIRRRVAEPIPEDYHKRQEQLDKKTLYVKGFKKNNTLDELLDYFKEHNVEHIYMRRIIQQNDKPFKGSLFVTFDTEDDAKKFLETKGLVYEGTELLKEWKTDYIKRKDEFYKNVKALKEKKLEKKAAMDKLKQDKETEIDVVPNCLLKLNGLKCDVLREHIKEVFEPHGTVVYVDYFKGNPSAVIRFDSGIASSVLEKLSEEDGVKKIEIRSNKAEVTLVEGDEETEYWKNIAVSRAQSRLKYNRGYRHQHRGNKGRFKKWGKRSNENEDKDDESAEPPMKKVKSEVTEENVKESSQMEVNSEAPKVKEFKVKEESSEANS